MPDSVPLATGDIEHIQNLHESSDYVYLTCPERNGPCTYAIEPDRPDDYDLTFLLDYPYCIDCGCSLVIIGRDDYDGPEPQFHDLDEKGSPVMMG